MTTAFGAKREDTSMMGSSSAKKQAASILHFMANPDKLTELVDRYDAAAQGHRDAAEDSRQAKAKHDAAVQDLNEKIIELANQDKALMQRQEALANQHEKNRAELAAREHDIEADLAARTAELDRRDREMTATHNARAADLDRREQAIVAQQRKLDADRQRVGKMLVEFPTA